jgi:hypothetical protein
MTKNISSTRATTFLQSRCNRGELLMKPQSNLEGTRPISFASSGTPWQLSVQSLAILIQVTRSSLAMISLFLIIVHVAAMEQSQPV